MRVALQPFLPLSFGRILLILALLASSLRGAPQLVAIMDGESYEQESSATAPVARAFAFGAGVEFGTRVSGVTVTLQPPGRMPLAVPADDATSFYLERTFASRAALDAAFPEGRYIVTTAGTQAGSFALDLTVRKPNPPRLVSTDVYANEDVFPGRIVIDWTTTASGGDYVFAFSQIQILTEAGDVVASTPDYAPGVGGGAGMHWGFKIFRAPRPTSWKSRSPIWSWRSKARRNCWWAAAP